MKGRLKFYSHHLKLRSNRVLYSVVGGGESRSAGAVSYCLSASSLRQWGNC